MGLFGSKKKTYVSSSVWNMAGDIKDRPDYMKTVVTSNLLLNSPRSLGEDIPRAYLNGPGMGLRRYAKWAKGSSGYNDAVGFVGGGLYFGDLIDPAVLVEAIPRAANEFVLLNEYDIGLADPDWWGDQYMVKNHQDLLFTDWFSELNEATGDIKITFDDSTTVVFTPLDFNRQGKYIYALYQTIAGGTTGPTVLGPVVTVPTEPEFPAVPSGYLLYSVVVVETPTDFDVLTVVDATYSDGRPSEHTETPSVIAGQLANEITTYHKYTLIDRDSSTRELYVQERKDKVTAGVPVVTELVEDLGGGITKTTTTTVTTQTTEKEYIYHFDTQTVANNSVSEYRYFLYQQGTGSSALDALFKVPESAGQYLPYIPIRINNQFLRDTDSVIYKKTKRAYFKAMSGGSLDKVVEKVEDNDQIGDLDFVYAVYGASLNSPEMAAKNYLFQFFKKIYTDSGDTYARFDEWERKWQEALESVELYEEWARSYYPGQNESPPEVKPYPELPVVSLDTRSTSGVMNFHMSIQMNGVKVTSGIGRLLDHKKGDYWLEVRPTKVYVKKFVQVNTQASGSGYQGSYSYPVEVEHLIIYNQVTDNSWEAVEVFGLVHKNYVYDGKWVIINGSEAMADSEESGFIVPIHEDTFRDMRLVDSTQLSTACCYLVFNCYKTVKKKWYQSGFFKILLVVGIVVVSVVFAPAGTGATGILGSSVAVGTTIGFTGTVAIVAGTVANAIAAIMVTRALTELFGDTLGPILGSVVTIALTTYGGIGGDFGNFDAGSVLTELGKADNLISLTDGLVKSVSAFMNDKNMKIMEETQRVMEQYKQDMLDVAKRYDEMFGTGSKGMIDPLLYTNAGYSGQDESRGAFIERTLMCGGDIAQMTQDLISNFSKVGLSLDLPS